MKSYQVGARVWWAHCGIQEVQETCAVCAGKLEVTLILGDGSTMVLPCEYCSAGYEGPRGYTRHHEYLAAAESVVITDITVHTGPDGETREYRSGGWCLDIEDIFDTEAEAMDRAAVKAAKFAQEVDAQKQSRGRNKGRPYTWNAGYHMREAKKAREQLEYHERMARVCKDKTRKPGRTGE